MVAWGYAYVHAAALQDVAGEVLVLQDVAQALLDEETGLCVAYDERFTLDAACKKVTPRTVQRPHLLPPGCAYRRLVESESDG